MISGILIDSSYNLIYNCNISERTMPGISFENCSNTAVSTCVIASNSVGITLDSLSTDNRILQCNITENLRGIDLADSKSNIISRCIIKENQHDGISRGFANNIFYNIFITNSPHASGELENINFFGYNYWDDYEDKGGYDDDDDGIGDTAYHVYGVNYDVYPLMQPDLLPIVKITYPSEGDCFAHETITVHGTTEDLDGTVELVEVRIDEGDWNTVMGTTFWSYKWNTESLDECNHILFVRCKDNMGYYSPNESVNVKIDLTSPDMEIITPREGFFYIDNREMFPTPLGRTIVYGLTKGITVQVKATDAKCGLAEEPKVYIRGKDYRTIWDPLDEYWEYDWKETWFGPCTLEAKAIDKAGNVGSSKVTVVWYHNIRL